MALKGNFIYFFYLFLLRLAPDKHVFNFMTYESSNYKQEDMDGWVSTVSVFHMNINPHCCLTAI